MDVYAKQKQRFRKHTCDYQRGYGSEKGEIRGIGLTNTIHSGQNK